MGSIPHRSSAPIFLESILSFFTFPPVYCLHVQCVAQNALDVDVATQIRHPVPGEYALNCKNHVLTGGPKHISEGLCSSWHVPVDKECTLMVHDTDIHRPYMQIDTVVELILFGIESSKASSLDMDSWLK